MLTIREISFSETALMKQIYQLRVVAREEAGYITAARYPDGWYDMEDERATHFTAFWKEMLVGAARICFYESLLEHPFYPAMAHLESSLPKGRIAYLGRVCTHPLNRGRGIRHELELYCERLARVENSLAECCDTQQVDYYTRHGWHALGQLRTDAVSWSLDPTGQYLMSKTL